MSEENKKPSESTDEEIPELALDDLDAVSGGTGHSSEQSQKSQQQEQAAKHG